MLWWKLCCKFFLIQDSTYQIIPLEFPQLLRANFRALEDSFRVRWSLGSQGQTNPSYLVFLSAFYCHTDVSFLLWWIRDTAPLTSNASIFQVDAYDCACCLTLVVSNYYWGLVLLPKLTVDIVESIQVNAMTLWTFSSGSGDLSLKCWLCWAVGCCCPWLCIPLSAAHTVDYFWEMLIDFKD